MTIRLFFHWFFTRLDKGLSKESGARAGDSTDQTMPIEGVRGRGLNYFDVGLKLPF